MPLPVFLGNRLEKTKNKHLLGIVCVCVCVCFNPALSSGQSLMHNRQILCLNPKLYSKEVFEADFMEKEGH